MFIHIHQGQTARGNRQEENWVRFSCPRKSCLITLISPASLFSRVYTSIPPHARCFSHSHSHSPVLVARPMHKLHARTKPSSPRQTPSYAPCHAMHATHRNAPAKEKKTSNAPKKKKRDTTRRKEETQKVTNPFATVYMNAMPCHAMMPKGQSGNQPERDHELLLTIRPRSASIHPCPIRP